MIITIGMSRESKIEKKYIWLRPKGMEWYIPRINLSTHHHSHFSSVISLTSIQFKRALLTPRYLYILSKRMSTHCMFLNAHWTNLEISLATEFFFFFNFTFGKFCGVVSSHFYGQFENRMSLEFDAFSFSSLVGLKPHL